MDLPVTLIGWAIFGGIAGIIAILGIGLRSLVNYVQVGTDNALLDRLSKWAATYVASLEQSPDLAGLAGEEKKERAMVWLVNKAEKLGFDLSMNEASHLIEAAVLLIKNSALPVLEEALDDVDE